VVKVKNMDKDRNLMNDPNNGIAITEYKYDPAGQRADTVTYNKDSQPIAMK
jgi:YD repeat-containing protein